jgi:hypothetical protein
VMPNDFSEDLKSLLKLIFVLKPDERTDI